MRHVWLTSLGVWAQAQEPSDSCRGLMGKADIASRHSLESREDSSKAASSSNGEANLTESRKRSHGHCHPPSAAQHGHHHHEDRCDVQAFDEYYQNETHNDACHHHGRGHIEAHEEHRHHYHDEPRHQHHDDRDNGHQHSRRHYRTYGYQQQHDHHDCHHTCPICLSPIAQSDLTVLRWCMHQFCITCIQKWSCMQRFCPLCKQIFHGWYYNIKSPSMFDKKDLAVKSSSQTSSQLRARGRRESHPIPRQVATLSVRRSKPLPWRRAFGFPRRTASAYVERVVESKADEEALQWRASIYKKNLRAVQPHVNSRIKVKQAPANDPERRARIERRLEPWIRRELWAITGDSDPSLLVHLALSLWLHVLLEREKITEYGTSGQQQPPRVPATEFGDAEAIQQLEPILQEKASTFWHELRCFAESPYSLRAYDSVTRYEKFRG